VFGTAAEAIEALSVPQIKVTKAYKTFEGRLQLGDFIKYPESAMSIDVMRYFKTKSAKPVSASSFVTRTAIGNGEGSAQSSHTIPDIQIPGTGDDLSAVKNARTYKVNDASAPGGKKDVERDELAKGYEYGRTAVHISESDENVTKLETFQSLTIIGFIPSDKVHVETFYVLSILTSCSMKSISTWARVASLLPKQSVTKRKWPYHL
jgi:ATP-dependent DNA helicase 2 subunit 2